MPCADGGLVKVLTMRSIVKALFDSGLRDVDHDALEQHVITLRNTNVDCIRVGKKDSLELALQKILQSPCRSLIVGEKVGNAVRHKRWW